MSKSYGNTIPIFSDEDSIRKRVMSIQTDSTPVDEPKNTESPIFTLYSLFLSNEERSELGKRFKSPGLKYGEVKKELAELIIELFKPFKKKREYLQSHKDSVIDILEKGAEKAAAVADSYLKKIRNAMGLEYK